MPPVKKINGSLSGHRKCNCDAHPCLTAPEVGWLQAWPQMIKAHRGSLNAKGGYGDKNLRTFKFVAIWLWRRLQPCAPVRLA